MDWNVFSNAGKRKVKVKSLSLVRLLATPWTEAHQAPPSMGFSRQEYWSGVPLQWQEVLITARKQTLAGEESQSQRSDRKATSYNRFVSSAKHSGDRAQLQQRKHILDTTHVYGQKPPRTVFVTNCITGYFSFCSVETIKHPNKGFFFSPTKDFNADFFFFAPMLLIAKCNSLIVMLNKCLFKKYGVCKVSLF